MTFATVVKNLVSLLNGSLVPLLYALAFLYFVWGATQLILTQGQEGRDKGRKKVIYGLIGLVIIFGVWGFVNLLLNTLTGALGTTTP